MAFFPTARRICTSGRRAKQRAPGAYCIESVETRLLFAATSTWVAPGGGEWDNNNNWTPALLPAMNDDVTIPAAGGGTVFHDMARADAVNSLTSGKALALDGGSLTVATTFAANGGLTFGGGTLDGGTLSGTAISVSSAGGTINGTTLNSNITVLSGATLNLTGTITNHATITVDSGGTLDVTGTLVGGVVAGKGTVIGDMGATFNGITLGSNLTVPAGDFTDLNNGLTLENNVTLTLNGQMAPLETETIGGTGQLVVNANAVLNPGVGDTTLTIGPDVSLSGAGRVIEGPNSVLKDQGAISPDGMAIDGGGGSSFDVFGTLTLAQNTLDPVSVAVNLEPGSTLSETLGPSASGEINLANVPLSLNGLLDIHLTSGFHPALHQTFNLVALNNGSTVSGKFASLDGVSLGGGLQITPAGVVGNNYQLVVQAVAAADKTAPTVQSVQASTLTTSQSAYTFTVTYADNVAINVSTLGSKNIKVTGPNNFSAFATLLSVSKTNNGTPRTATYSVTGPKGSFTASADGTYTLALQAKSVFDTAQTPLPVAPNNKLATFTVKIVKPSVGGGVFNDVSGNGIELSTDPPLAGFKIFADRKGTGKFAKGDPFAISNKMGNYTLQLPAPGTYTLFEAPRKGYSLTDPAAGSYVVTVTDGQFVDAMDWGNLKLKSDKRG